MISMNWWILIIGQLYNYLKSVKPQVCGLTITWRFDNNMKHYNFYKTLLQNFYNFYKTFIKLLQKFTKFYNFYINTGSGLLPDQVHPALSQSCVWDA